MLEPNGLDILVRALRLAARHDAVTIATSAEATSMALAIARQNKVESIVLRHIVGLADAPDAVVDVARILAGNSALLEDLRTVGAGLKHVGLEFIAIKGPLQQKVLHGDFFQRAAADLDILVRPRDYARARSTLAALGYSSATPSLWWRMALGEEHFKRPSTPRTIIDLHQRVHQPGAPAALDGEILFEGLVEIDVGGVAIPTLSVQGGLLLCTVSIAKALFNHEPAGAHVFDLYAGLMAATPEAVNGFFTLARRSGLGGHLAVALRMVEAVFDASLSPPAEGSSFVEIRDDDLLRMIFLPRHHDTNWPKRRWMLWALVEERPGRYIIELARAMCSDVLRRTLEHRQGLTRSDRGSTGRPEVRPERGA